MLAQTTATTQLRYVPQPPLAAAAAQEEEEEAAVRLAGRPRPNSFSLLLQWQPQLLGLLGLRWAVAGVQGTGKWEWEWE